MTNYLIDFVDSTTLAEMTEYFTEHNCTLITCFNKFHRTCHVQSDNIPPQTSIVTLVQDDDLTPIKLLTVVPVTVIAPADYVEVTNEVKNWWKVYSMKSIDIGEPSWTLPVFGDSVNVYVMDSGIEITHPEFLNKNVELLYSFTGEFADTKGHGTALSSVIIGNTCGLTNATLKVVKVFDVNQPTKQSDFLYAFDAIYQDSVSSPNKFSVVNLSWSIARNSYIENKINILINSGVVVVAASGNSGIPIADVTPAAMPNVLTIGSFGVDFLPSTFSDYSDSVIRGTVGTVNGGELDSWAPGEQIWCAGLGGTYGFSFGTSVAAAIYSGEVAYNYGQRLTEKNDIGSFRRELSGVVKNGLICNKDRTGLLDLTDPKYATSVNKVCTYINMREIVPTEPVLLPVSLPVNVGKLSTRSLFFPALTASYEFLDPLPDFCSMETNMLCAIPIADPVTGSSTYEKITIRFRVNQLDGTTYENVVTVVVMGTTFVQEDLPVDDPIISYILLVPCEGNRYSCGVKNCTGPSTFCYVGAKSFCFCGTY